MFHVKHATGSRPWSTRWCAGRRPSTWSAGPRWTTSGPAISSISAQLAALIPTDAKTLADLGSGGGFPGLVAGGAAARSRRHPDRGRTPARRPSWARRPAAWAWQKQPKIVIGRIEAAPPAKADVVTARAAGAARASCSTWADRHRTDTAICLFHKGKGWQVELTEAMKDWDIPSPALHQRDRP